ncbi:exodeoxyribonuclease VII large subunit [Desulfobotulus alkaliphilus]|uniref:Exodeoxyribonuclease 7 large subunit n=1 Tax=Desulfobotulus alkaliphilus TaxID=622671 RepID=A0A562S0X0_9BACT|nr:exodeoxyribonuclease VII large subunit [Desulfobotulus alkaliphilus]TWI74326.1 exodeoxyribonuclease VII large subunit [Desulfobotulus alkaliphilus]
MGTEISGKDVRKIHTISELTSDIRSRLESAYPFVWIVGEISNLSRPSSGHLYFSLKDNSAQIAALMFRGQNRQLRFQPENGLKVTGFGRISVYPPRGSYQIILEYLEPAGAGSLQLAFEQLKRRLEAEGLFDAVHKRPLPFLPQRISLVTSPDGAALHDMLKVLKNRYPNLHIEVAPVPVQGEGADRQIASALKKINALNRSDLIILARGGGSLEDLAAFNSEDVARAVFESEIPVITGVGHETDFTIADFTADYRASTPTAAAESAVPVKERLKTEISSTRNHLCAAFKSHLSRLRLKNLNMQEKLLHPRRSLSLSRIRLDETEEKLLRRFKRLIAWKKQQLGWTEKALSPAPLFQWLQQKRMQHAQVHKMLHFYLSEDIRRKRIDSENLQQRLNSLNPFAVLERGYAVARKLPEKSIIRETGNLRPGDSIEIQLARGSLRCRIEEMDHGKKKL